VINFTLWPPHPWNSIALPLNRRLSEPGGQAGNFEEQKIQLQQYNISAV